MHFQATASRAATLLRKNPALFCRVMLGKLNTARRMPALPARKRVNGVHFEYALAEYRGTAPMYFGSYAPLVVEVMRRILRPGDIFFDVGANIGYLSAIAAGLVGPRGQVHAFEPVPAYCDRLRLLAEMNSDRPLFVNAQAAGDTPGSHTVYITREPGQNTMVRSYQSPSEIVATLDVPVVRLDDSIETNRVSRISLLKIDAEGFELPVLKGLVGYFSSTAERPPIVCEIAPRAYALQGNKLADLAAYMSSYGYSAHDLIDMKTPVDLCAVANVEDVLFLAAANN